MDENRYEQEITVAKFSELKQQGVWKKREPIITTGGYIIVPIRGDASVIISGYHQPLLSRCIQLLTTKKSFEYHDRESDQEIYMTPPMRSQKKFRCIM